MTDFSTLFIRPDPRVNVYGNTGEDRPDEWRWRVESAYTWNADGTCSVSAHYERWAILRRTSKGAWVVPFSYRDPQHKFTREMAEKTKKLVLNDARRMWAYPTRAAAWDSFAIRQSRRLQHARNALEVAEAMVELVRKVEEMP